MSSLLFQRFWSWPWELQRRRILGINARNIGLLLELNPRGFYPALDDKVLTKRICEEREIPVPETFAVIVRNGDLRCLPRIAARHPEFVVKPARGAGGRGVLVVARQDGEEFETASGQILSSSEVRYHILTLLSGSFSLGDSPDRAIFEQRVVPHPMFDRFALGGTPDIRVIVYRNMVVMAMLRLPTRASRGRANLHQGAVGVGIDIESGRTFGGVYRDRAVTVHPETGVSIQELSVPHWGDVLAIAVRLSEAFGLGYVGVDIVLDVSRGPLVLEANARPGLSVQIANRCGLLSRLEGVDGRMAQRAAPAPGSVVAATLPDAS